jgi:hypothetical protein
MFEQDLKGDVLMGKCLLGDITDSSQQFTEARSLLLRDGQRALTRRGDSVLLC